MKLCLVLPPQPRTAPFRITDNAGEFRKTALPSERKGTINRHVFCRKGRPVFWETGDEADFNATITAIAARPNFSAGPVLPLAIAPETPAAPPLEPPSGDVPAPVTPPPVIAAPPVPQCKGVLPPEAPPPKPKRIRVRNRKRTTAPDPTP